LDIIYKKGAERTEVHENFLYNHNIKKSRLLLQHTGSYFASFLLSAGFYRTNV